MPENKTDGGLDQLLLSPLRLVLLPLRRSESGQEALSQRLKQLTTERAEAGTGWLIL